MTDYKQWEKFDENSASKEIEELDGILEFESKLNKIFEEQQSRNVNLQSSLFKISESLKSKISMEKLKARGSGPKRRTKTNDNNIFKESHPVSLNPTDIDGKFNKVTIFSDILKSLSVHLSNTILSLSKLPSFIEDFQYKEGYTISSQLFQNLTTMNNLRNNINQIFSDINNSKEIHLEPLQILTSIISDHFMTDLDQHLRNITGQILYYYAIFCYYCHEYAMTIELCRCHIKLLGNDDNSIVWLLRAKSFAAIGCVYLCHMNAKQVYQCNQEFPNISIILDYLQQIELEEGRWQFTHSLTDILHREAQRQLHHHHHHQYHIKHSQMTTIITSKDSHNSNKLKKSIMNSKLCFISVALLQSFFIDYHFQDGNTTATTTITTTNNNANNYSNTTSSSTSTTTSSNNNSNKSNNDDVNEDIFLSDNNVTLDHVGNQASNEFGISNSNNDDNDSHFSNNVLVPQRSPPASPLLSDIRDNCSPQINSLHLLINDILLSIKEIMVGGGDTDGAAIVVDSLRRMYYEAQILYFENLYQSAEIKYILIYELITSWILNINTSDNTATTGNTTTGTTTTGNLFSNNDAVTLIDYLIDLIGSCLFNIATCRLNRPKDKVPSIFSNAPYIRNAFGDFSQLVNKILENCQIQSHDKIRKFLNIIYSISLENLISMSALQICDFGLLHFDCISGRVRKALILEQCRDYDRAITLLIETKKIVAITNTDIPSRLDLDLFCDVNKDLFFSQRFIMNCKLPLLDNDLNRNSIDDHDYSYIFTPRSISQRVNVVNNYIDSKINRLYYLRDFYG